MNGSDAGAMTPHVRGTSHARGATCSTRRASRDRGRERGSASVELPFLLGMVVLPFALLVLQLPIWVQRQAAAADAAAEIARSFAVQGDGSATDILLRAIETSHGVPAGALHSTAIAEVSPGAPIVVAVTVDIPVLTIPIFGTIGRQAWTATHIERQPDFGSVEP